MKIYKNIRRPGRDIKNATTSVTSQNHNLFRKDGMVTYNYRLFINEFDDAKLDEIFDTLYDGESYDTLEVRISSPGGYLLDLQRFQNVIENYFQNRTFTILDNHGYSAGALMFLLGTERIAHRTSMIMFHDWSGGYWGKASDIDKQHKFQREQYKIWMRDLLSNFFTDKEIEDMFEGKEYWYNTLEMCKKGIATHVMINGEKLTAKEYIAFEKENTKLKKSINSSSSKSKPKKQPIFDIKENTEKTENIENVEKSETSDSAEGIEKPKTKTKKVFDNKDVLDDKRNDIVLDIFGKNKHIKDIMNSNNSDKDK